MNIKRQLTSILLGSTMMFAASSQAEQDYERIHKDITVMSNIIKGAFESDSDCRGCRPRIEANYLANQGAVFTIRMNSWRSFSHNYGGNDHGYTFTIPSPEDPQHIEITEVVGEVLDSVGMVMDEVGNHIELRLGDFEEDQIFLRQDSDTRRALRELNRKRRDLEFQRRENEIELIHANEDQRKRIEKSINDIEAKVAVVEEQQAELSKTFEVEREEREKLRQVKVKKAKLQAEQQQTAIEDIVLQSLCDYGATLKNVPKDEHVSLLFERPNDEASRVLVMNMKDVQGCSRTDVLRKDAVSYRF